MMDDIYVMRETAIELLLSIPRAGGNVIAVADTMRDAREVFSDVARSAPAIATIRSSNGRERVSFSSAGSALFLSSQRIDSRLRGLTATAVFIFDGPHFRWEDEHDIRRFAALSSSKPLLFSVMP